MRICNDIGCFIFIILEWKFSRFTSMTESYIWNERNVIPKSFSGTDPLPFHYTKLMLYRNTRRQKGSFTVCWTLEVNVRSIIARAHYVCTFTLLVPL